MKMVVYSKTAQKALQRIPRNWAIRISDKIAAYASDPAAQANNVTALQGSDGLSRLRVGDWRVIMWDHVVLEILEIKSRGSAYKD
jgi:mRNA interferase RelE/StbE